MVWCFLVQIMLTETYGDVINGDERIIDYVGEPNHRQPQDAPPNTRLQSTRHEHDTRESYIAPNSIEESDEDLQQRQQPESISPIFGKGTYLEFVAQEKQHN